jgi:hypothetical protein
MSGILWALWNGGQWSAPPTLLPVYANCYFPFVFFLFLLASAETWEDGKIQR